MAMFGYGGHQEVWGFKVHFVQLDLYVKGFGISNG